MTKHQDMVNLYQEMIDMKENFQMMELVVMEYIIMVMIQLMKDIGMMILKKVMELKLGKINLNIKENIKMVKNMVLVFMYGQMVLCMKVNGLIIV